LIGDLEKELRRLRVGTLIFRLNLKASRRACKFKNIFEASVMTEIETLKLWEV
jgi:hypothetical protein